MFIVCELGQFNSGQIMVVWCVLFEVLENCDDLVSCKIKLCLVVVCLNVEVVIKDMLVFFVGGLGQVVIENVVVVFVVFDLLFVYCNLLLLDQCGIGGLYLLSCKNDEKLVMFDDDVEDDLVKFKVEIICCLV